MHDSNDPITSAEPGVPPDGLRRGGPVPAEPATLAAIIEQADDAIIGLTVDGLITSWNAGAARLFGYRAADIIGRPITRLASPPDDLADRLAPLRRGERRRPYETTWQRQGGQPVAVSVSLSPINDHHGRRSGLVAIARDISERRLAEVQQRRRAERAAALLEVARALGEAGLIVPTLLETIARRAAELSGSLCVIRLLSDDGQWLRPAAFHHTDPDALAMMREGALTTPYRVDQGLTGQVMRSGELVLMPAVSRAELLAHAHSAHRAFFERFAFASFIIVPLRARGRVLGTLFLARDPPLAAFDADDQTFLQDLADHAALAIDNARLYQAEQATVRQRDEFLSIAAHELRTPVTGLKGYVQLLQRLHARGQLDEGRLLRSLQVLDTTSTRLAVLIGDLIDIARIRTGQLPLRREPLDLAGLLQTLVMRYREGLAAPQRLRLLLAVSPCPLVADRDRLEQVLTNLLDNAVKYSPEGSDIAVALRPWDEGVLVTVQDQGIGLPPGVAELIFEPFGRAANATGQHLPGMGLGLSICRNIVERHGGRIWATSQGEGHGTTLSVWLPRPEEGAAPTGAPTGEQHGDAAAPGAGSR